MSDPRSSAELSAYLMSGTENARLRAAMETAKTLIGGALNDKAPAAVKASNINQAWHILNDNLRHS